MFTLPYLLLGAALALAVSFGGGWHYGSKGAAADKAALEQQLVSATQTNAQLAASVGQAKADCQRAVESLKADVGKRKAAVKAAKKAASDAAAEQRGVISGLKLRAYTAADAESNCAAARDILNQVAQERAK